MKRAPGQDELRKILLSADKKVRVTCVVFTFSSLRIQVLGNYKDDDELYSIDFSELSIKVKEVSFRQVSIVVI
ncbi:MAG: hypothetical protein QW738_07545 [Nitrososphaeria archaeon]